MNEKGEKEGRKNVSRYVDRDRGVEEILGGEEEGERYFLH